MSELKFWIVKRPDGKLLPWMGAHRNRADAITEAIPGCMGYPEYEDLGTDSKRWQYLYRRGYRVVRITAKE